VAAHRRTIVDSDAALDLADVAVPTAVPRTCLATALLDGEALVGVLTVYSEGSDRFSEEDGQLARMMAPHVARMLAVSRASALAPSPPRAARPAPADSARDLRVVASR
jgi:GAF domain-containing protein